MSLANFVARFWQDIAGWFLLINLIVTVATLLWVLNTKRETLSAIAWCLTVILVPLLGAFLFFLFGYQSIARPLNRRKRRQTAYKKFFGTRDGQLAADTPDRWDSLAKLGFHDNGFPVTNGNAVTLYHDGQPAFQAMLEAIRAARHHVHIQFFIFRADESGKEFVDALLACAARGVQVRFLYDSIGSYSLSRSFCRQLTRTNCRTAAFLPMLNPFYRLRVNLRNHRKILVVDGKVGFTGGLNIGREYLGRDPKFGRWRDTHLRLVGPAVEGLQRTFLEDWHFAAEEAIHGPDYYPVLTSMPGNSLAQVVHSGPDADYKAIRETYFAAIIQARRRVWIASPYFVPDSGLRDALCLAARTGVDVRYLGLFRPDKWLPFLAARYYWVDMLQAGVKIYQYTPGMMHSKYVLVDGEWASVGSANLDNRSLLLNFEANCQLFDSALVAELEREFLKDLDVSVRLEQDVFATRPLFARIAENAARLFSPVL